MALLQNEEYVILLPPSYPFFWGDVLSRLSFAIWYMRTSYLANVKDGIGERLINVNNSILNRPGFRAAGWLSEPVQRTYSPPIPTTGTADYFQNAPSLRREISHADDEDEGGMVTGRTSNDTVGPGPNIRRRKRKETIDDDDSSDLSDESDDGEGAQRAAQQIRFAKMPSRSRAGSSPIRSYDPSNPDVMITSPSKPKDGRRRTGSLGAVEAVKARARADTATSSDLSSEAEPDPAYFQRRHINAKQTQRSTPLDSLTRTDAADSNTAGTHDDSDGDSIGSDLSSDLGDPIGSGSVLNVATTSSPTSSPILAGAAAREPPRMQAESPKRTRTLPPLQELPPARPISVMPPVSLLSRALNAQKATPKNPIQAFATLSAKGSPDPLWIRIYAPFSSDPEEPVEMPLARTSKEGGPVMVAEAIGFALWRYSEEEIKPALKPEQLNVNNWVFRMVEDGEVDYDFPALVRTRPITDFTSNNNRGARGRSRGKPFDDFALVEASGLQLQANNKETPQYIAEQIESTVQEPQRSAAPTVPPPLQRAGPSRSNVLAGQPFATALANTSLTPADRPAPIAPQATPRIDKLKQIRVRHFDVDIAARTTTLEVSADSYIAEILDHVCKKWNFDKAFFVLKVSGTNTVAPLDRTVEALGTRSDLELVRRRFGAGPSSLIGSPGSASPNAPLLLDIQGPTKKSRKGQGTLQAMAQKQDLLSSASNFKKYYVTRKQLTSFTQGSQRVLIFDGDFMHVMPADTAKTTYAKTSSIAFSDMLKCKVSTKHSKLVRVLVRRPSESKRYDFEARTAGEAQEIVDEISREMRQARG